MPMVTAFTMRRFSNMERMPSMMRETPKLLSRAETYMLWRNSRMERTP